MKNIVLIILLSAGYLSSAQDVFQTELYSADLVLKYRNKIGLSDQQTKIIRKIYNANIADYNALKWDLDAEMVNMNTLLTKKEVDSTASIDQLHKILALESALKLERLSILLGIKKQLTESQQIKLKEYAPEKPFNFITPISENPRVVLKVDGPEIKGNPIVYVIDKKGKRKVSSEEMSSINPDDIDAIEVLKGAGAIKLYGEEGKKGVVIIKLKKRR